MQYIQLQPQITSQVPTPANGSLNFFLDVETNQIQTKGHTGDIATYSTITGGTYSDSTLTFFDNLGVSFSVSGITSGGGASLVSVTYSQLINLISTSGLTPASSYLITNFRTCYDQPDFNWVGNAITTGNYKQAAIEPIVVFATSVSTISIDAYQPTYPNDKIQYDWTYSATETTNGVAYGRITERIDEFNNRTDYDHRTILFKRYRLFTHRQGQPLNGSIELFSDGSVSGTSTSFDLLNVGDVIYIPDLNISYYEITGITNNTSMGVSGDTILADGGGLQFYKAIEETNDINGYFSYKRTNVKTNDFVEYTTFGNAISDSYAKNNYVGNYANIYTTLERPFLLANNVFLEGSYQTNKFGDYCHNNTFGTDNSNNIWGDWCYGNVSTNDIDDNIIGHYFYDNLMNVNLDNNHIGNNFYNNRLLAENNQAFKDNIIGNDFNDNTIYSWFYDNQIGNRFESNTLGDFGNLDNLEFRRNVILNDFNQNLIRKDFQNNQIGNQFNENVVNGDFYKNIIGNGFYFNKNIGHNFYGNHIGNGFNENDVIGDYFQDNQIGEYFNSNNNISYFFKDNKIGNQFENNTLGNSVYFNWDNTTIENLTGRTYDTFYSSLFGSEGNNVDNLILGKEFIMHFNSDSGTTIDNGSLIIGDTYEITNYIGDDDFTNVADVQSGNINENGCVFIAVGETPTSWSSGTELTELTIYNEYHKVKFTQWTQNNNGGGFSYERTKVYPTVESTVYFTKPNSSSKVDVIVDGRLEIRRDNDGAIYNIAKEGNWDNNQSPVGTEWNSIYTQSESINGSYFDSNTIGNEFKGNFIFTYFSVNNIKPYVGGNVFSGSVYNNQIGSTTFDNQFLGQISDNTWNDNFYQNIIGDNFDKNICGSNFSNNVIDNNFKINQIGDDFYENTIGNGFQTNQIENYFNNNTIGIDFGYGYAIPQGNKIGNNFYNNTVGEYFYNNTISDNFTENTIGNYFQWNIVNTSIDSTDFTPNYGNITGFTHTAIGTSATDDIYIGLTGVTTSEFGVNATFDIEVSGGAVIGVSGNTSGKLYVTGDTITILGAQIGGYSNAIDSISDDGVGKNGSDGSYNLSATGSTGTDANFDVSVSGGLVDSVTIGDRGNGYEIGDELTIIGSLFGGTDGVDDITITVTALFDDDVVITVSGVTIPSVYGTYTCQLFERQGGAKRLSFYDENDTLTITNINE